MAEGPTTGGPASLVLAASIARRFYLDDRSKVDIGAEFGLSRFKVARILEQARASGLVHVEIRLPGEIDDALSEQLRTHLGLARVIVVDTPAEPEESLRRHLAAVTADLLTELVDDNDVLGLTWSRTIEVATASLTGLASCPIVQLAGTLTGSGPDTVEVVRSASAVGGGRPYQIYAPLVVQDTAVAESFRQQSGIAEAMRHFDELTKAVVSIGAWSPGVSTVWDTLSETERRDYQDRGACAEISGRLLDTAGRELDTGLDDRVIAITIEQLRAVPEVIAIAGGTSRAAAVAAAAAAGCITTLVTDAGLAGVLLGQGGAEPI